MIQDSFPKTRSFKNEDAKLHSFNRRREAPKTRSFRASAEDAELQSFTEDAKLRRRGASKTKTRSFRASKLASTEDPKTPSFRASTEDTKTPSFRASKLQKRRRGASKLQSFRSFRRSSTEDAEFQSFKSFRSFKAKAKTRSFRASKLQSDSGTTLPMRSNNNQISCWNCVAQARRPSTVVRTICLYVSCQQVWKIAHPGCDAASQHS